MSAILKVLVTLGTKLLAEAALTELFIFMAQKLAESTKTKADDQLVEIIKKHLN